MTVALVARVEQRAAFLLGIGEMPHENLGVGIFEIVARIFLLGLAGTRRHR